MFSLSSLSSRTRDLVGVFLFLSLLTLLFAFYYDPYLEFGSEILENPILEKDLGGWSIYGEVAPDRLGGVRLQAQAFELRSSLSQDVLEPGRFHYLRLSGELRTEDVKPGPKNWHTARLILASYDADNKWLPVPHLVVGLTGTNGWHRYSETFTISDQARLLRVSAQLPHATGKLWVKNLSLREVRKKNSAIIFQIAVFLLWGGFLVILLVPYFIRTKQLLLSLLLALGLAFLFFGVLTPGHVKQKIGKDAVYKIVQIQENASQASGTASGGENSAVDFLHTLELAGKGGHFLIFCFLGVILTFICSGGSTELFLDLGMLAGATEMMQFFVEGRTPMLTDWGIDMAGVLTGFMIYLAFQAR